ncbi:hypothetical protein ASD90_18245 [Terrabacter sp. Root181]|nr:hypothetical protein ASD90_18245 [Terrabacter sp. Root181]
MTQIQGMGDPLSMAIGSGLVGSTYVVVGASGILAPLGRSLFRVREGEGHPFRVGISRGSRLAEGDWDRRFALDARDPRAVRRMLADLRSDGVGVDVAVGYAGALSPESWSVLARAAAHAVIVLPSRFADPLGGEEAAAAWLPTRATTRVLLGWAGGDGDVRWHTPEEISRVVADAVLDERAEPLTVGRVTPWSERPA